MKNLIIKTNNKNINSQKPENMKEAIKLTQNNSKNINMKQVDYLKIKVENVKQLCKDALVEHPTIKNRYKLKQGITDFHGNILHGNNIDIYFNRNTLYLDTSISYLLNGHNYAEISPNNVRDLMHLLTIKLGVNLFDGNVKSFEVAQIFHPENKFKYLTKVFQGIDKMELQKKNTSFIAYGRDNLQFKFYKVAQNLKRKANTKNLAGNLNLKNAVKTELKFNNDKRYTLQQFIDYGIEDCHEHLLDVLENQTSNTMAFNYTGEKFDDILFLTLLLKNGSLANTTRDQILGTIDRMDLSYATKTARRNSLKKKLNLFDSTHAINFLELLQNNLDNGPLWKDYHAYNNKKNLERLMSSIDSCTEPAF